MFAHPLEEIRACAQQMLTELRHVIPAFLARLDQPNRGGRWIEYLTATRQAFAAAADAYVADAEAEPRDEVTLTDFDREGETKVVAAALYAASALPDDQLQRIARRMSAGDRAALLAAYIGDRANRRHRPGRAFERTSYRFDILADYGAFRDLQRHRLLTIEWQPLTTRHGYVEPAAIEEAGALSDWRRVMDQSAELFEQLAAGGLEPIAPYAVVMAYRVRFYMEMNAREAMHVIELRTSPQGHPSYRRICQLMHKAIAEVAGLGAGCAGARLRGHPGGGIGRLYDQGAPGGEGRPDRRDGLPAPVPPPPPTHRRRLLRPRRAPRRRCGGSRGFAAPRDRRRGTRPSSRSCRRSASARSRP